jgi:tRNA(Ile)-lysidine synthase
VNLRFRGKLFEAAAALIGRCTFPEPGEPLDCAVSGGADSLALLVLAVAADCVAVAHHVDHGLREGSEHDVEAVNEAASALGVEVIVHRVTITPGPNLEARARDARFGTLPRRVATGHTGDDQAETMLLNLLRGASTDGLGAMRPGPRHPILGLRRAETRRLCSALGLSPVTDPTNADSAYLRNRVRHELLPVLCELAGRDVVPVLARQARLLAEDAALLGELASAVDPTDAKRLTNAPGPLGRRAVREWLREGHPPDLATVERVLSVAAGAALAADIGAGRSVRRSRGTLRLETRDEPVAVSASAVLPEANPAGEAPDTSPSGAQRS